MNFGYGFSGREFSNYTPLVELGDSILAYWDANTVSSMTLGGGNAVSSWRDLKNNYNVIQATGASQPVYSATSFNGKAGLTFDGTDDSLSLTPSPFPTGAAPYEFWALFQQDDVALAERLVICTGNASTTNRGMGKSASLNRLFGRVGTGASSVGAVYSIPDMLSRHVGRMAVGATNYTLTVDGRTSVTSTACVPATASDRFRIGANTNTVASTFWLGQIAAILVTNQLTVNQATSLQNWLMTRR